MPLYTRWQSKPWPGVPIDWANPLAQGLTVALPLWEGTGNPADVAMASSWSLGGGTGIPSWTSTPAGKGLSFTGANNQYVQGPKLSTLGIGNNAWSIAWSGSVNATSGTFVVIDGGPDDNSMVVFNSGSLQTRNNGYSFTSLGYTYDTLWHNYAVSYLGGTATLWVDGARFAPVSIGTLDWTGSTAKIGLGATTALWGYDGTMGHLMAWSQALSDSLAYAASVNPWQVFFPQSGWLFNPAAAVTGSHPTSVTVFEYQPPFSVIYE